MEATPVTMIECPYCSESINAKAKKCRHCGEILDPQMRELELLKSQKTAPNVFMNAGGGAAAAGSPYGLRRFRHFLHIVLCILTGGLWLPVYLILFIFRNKRYYL